jgi:DNA-binding transcriptional ArsR family regulator
MISPHESPQLDILLSALANEKRRSILYELSLMPSTTSRLAKNNGLTLPAIHKHILILENSGLIIRKKSGRTNFIAFNPNTFGIIQKWLLQYQTQWGDVNASFENYVSRMNE